MGPTSLAITLGCLFVTNLQPEGGAGLGLLPVQTEGEAPSELEAGLTEHLRSGLASFAPTEVAAGTLCADPACYREAAAHANARVLVEVRVSAQERDYALRLRLVNARDGEIVREDESRCEICTYDEVLEHLDQALANLAAPIEAALSRATISVGRVRIVSRPSDAIVRVDGTVVGSTPYQGELEAGAHVIELSKEGYRPEQRSLDLQADTEPAFEVELARARTPSAARRIIGWSAVALAVPLVATGIALIVIDENPYEPSCDGLEGTCAQRYNTLVGGVVALVGGVAAAGAGATLLVLDRRQKGEVEAWLGPGGAGLRGRF